MASSARKAAAMDPRQQTPLSTNAPDDVAAEIRVGVLALQGDFHAHAVRLRSAGPSVREVCEVRRPRDLEGLRGLVIPGGESTTLLKLLQFEGLETAIRDFHTRGGHLFGTCAGLILLARDVENPPQRSLDLIDATVRRNAYGRQVDSFIGRGCYGPAAEPIEMVFIRAPRIVRCGPAVEVLATLDGEPVLVRQGRILGATFHPEMSAESSVHADWVASISFPGGV